MEKDDVKFKKKKKLFVKKKLAKQRIKTKAIKRK